MKSLVLAMTTRPVTMLVVLIVATFQFSALQSARSDEAQKLIAQVGVDASKSSASRLEESLKRIVGRNRRVFIQSEVIGAEILSEKAAYKSRAQLSTFISVLSLGIANSTSKRVESQASTQIE